MREKLFVIFGALVIVYLIADDNVEVDMTVSTDEIGNNAAIGAATWFSNSAISLIAEMEGFSPTPYKDAGGWSIGFGHYMGTSPTIHQMSRETALAYLEQDATTAANAILDSVTVPLNQNQFDALTSFIYNEGVTAFKNSTLLKKINAGDFDGAVDQFSHWIYSQGKVLEPLRIRRKAEAYLFAS